MSMLNYDGQSVTLDIEVPSAVHALDQAVEAAYEAFRVEEEKLDAAVSALEEVADLEAEEKAKIAQAAAAGKPPAKSLPAGYFDEVRKARKANVHRQGAKAQSAANHYEEAILGSAKIRPALAELLVTAHAEAIDRVAAAHAASNRLRGLGMTLRTIDHQKAYRAGGRYAGTEAGHTFDDLHRNDKAHARPELLAEAWRTVEDAVRAFPADGYRLTADEAAEARHREEAALIAELGKHGADGRSVIRLVPMLLAGAQPCLTDDQRRALALARLKVARDMGVFSA